MDFIIGGAYQGKLEYAVKKYSLTENDIFICSDDEEIGFDRRCIHRLEEYVMRCVKNGADAVEIFRANRGSWEDKVIICRDIFCGVVPMGADIRAWREMTGRLCGYLSSEADSVTRIFCGLEQRLK